MQVNANAVFNLINHNFNGNISKFCRALKLSYSTVWRVLNGHSAGNCRFIPALSSYCKENGLSVFDYVKI
jgi:L-2-hydroxyglutarate oxidase LhgO